MATKQSEYGKRLVRTQKVIEELGCDEDFMTSLKPMEMLKLIEMELHIAKEIENLDS